MKTGRQILMLALAFACGWALRGAQPPETQVEPKTATQQQPLTANKANELEQNIRASKASDQSVQEAFGDGLNESLLQEFEQLLFSGQFDQASATLHQISSQLQPVDIEFPGALFTTCVIQFGLDEYQFSFSLMNTEVQLSSLDRYSPSSQFFDVLEQAHLNPQAALAAYDDLSSYYQQQVTSSQLKHLENWLGRFKFYLHQRQAILYLRSGSDPEGPPHGF